MLLTPHTLVGAAIGASTNNLVSVIILAFLSHFILDALPHTDWALWHNHGDFEPELKDYILVGCDFLLSAGLITYLWYNSGRDNLILVGAIFAAIPDFIDVVPFWNKFLRKLPVFSQLHWLHEKIHFRLKPKYWYWGVVTQLIIIGGSLWYLLG